MSVRCSITFFLVCTILSTALFEQSSALNRFQMLNGFRAGPKLFHRATSIHLIRAFQKSAQHSSCSSKRTRGITATRLNQATPTTGSYYITTPIYYVNGEPHLGHAYTSVLSDIMARFTRLDGRETFFLTGTDEHGQKVEQSATAAGQSPIKFADDVSAKFRRLASILGCSNNDFIRTTEPRHKVAVQALWDKLKENGQIYLGAYEGWYSIRDEAFYAESELVDGKAPTGAPVEWVKEESYFFKLSEWTQKLLDFYESHPDFIGPKARRNEVVSFVSQEGGLKDLSISRTTFSWGIPVSEDPQHVVYVWLDALTNYLSAVGYPDMQSELYKKFWPASVHIVGKDILRFHAIFWPAFLLAAGLEPPKRIFAHGWWTKDGEKMSKSIGNVLDPIELISKYGVDYVRYYMAAEINFGNDGDFSDQSFCNRINSDLANDVGNLAQRVLTMIQKNCDGKVPEPTGFTEEDTAIFQASEDCLPKLREAIETQNIKFVCEQIVNIAKLGNKYIDTQAPWTLRKTDIPRFNTVMYVLVEVIRRVAILLQPLVPTASSIMLDQLGAPPEFRGFQSIATKMPVGTIIGTPSPIFPKLECPEVINGASDVKPRGESATGDASPKKQAKSSASKISAELLAQYSQLPLDNIATLITETGNDIRTLKSDPTSSKEALQQKVSSLLALKESYKVLNGGKAFEG